MRVTDGMVAEASRLSMERARGAVMKASQAAGSGMRVQSPGDDPSAASQARRLTEDKTRIEATMKAADEGSRGLDAIDGTLAQMHDMLTEARVLAIQGANDTLGPNERSAIADQIAGLRSALLETTSTRMDGRYVLNGLREDAPPYDASGNFVGDRSRRAVEASVGHFVDTGLAIGEVLSPTTAGTDVFGELSALETALRSGNTAGMQAGIDAMTSFGDRVADARTEVGGRMQAFDMARALGEKLSARATDDVSNLVEIDVYEAISALTSAQTALQQAVTIASKLPLPGLIDRM